jgi:hypothetical protein
MNKVLAKNGARHNMETLFEDLQEYIKNGTLQTLGGLITTYGVFAKRAQDGTVTSDDTSLKVTYTTPGYVNVAAGYGITSNMDYISVDTPQSVALSTDGAHTLYAKATKQLSEYTAVMNGFKYNVNENLTATREIDSYEFVWDTAPLAASGLVLANVASVSGIVSGITDRRHENLFTMNLDGMPGNVIRTDYTSLQVINSDLTVSGIFKVNDAVALTQGDVPPTPKRFVIKDIIPAEKIEHIDSSMSAILPIDSKKALQSIHATVKLEWGLVEKTVGNGASGLVVLSCGYDYMTPYVDDNSMVGMHLFHHTWNKDYLISSNTQTGSIYTIHVTNLDGSTVAEDLGTGSVTLHEGADFYEIVAVPYTALTPTPVIDKRQIREWTITYAIDEVNGNDVVIPRATIDLPLGQAYSIYVRSCTQFMRSNYLLLYAGGYTKEDEPNKYVTSGYASYTSPTIISYASLAVGDASIAATPTYAGFKLAINPGTSIYAGWTIATAYEILYTNATGGVNTTTPNYQRIVTNHTEVEIATPGRYTYYILVRPLLGGQVGHVGLTTTVVSGAGGAAPNDTVVAQVPVNFRTYQCVIDSVQARPGVNEEDWSYKCIVSNTVTPAYSGTGTQDMTIAGVDENGDFTTLTGWVKYNSIPWDSTGGGGVSIDTGRLKMKCNVGPNLSVEPETEAVIQGFIIPSGVSSANFQFNVSFLPSSPSAKLKAKLFVGPSTTSYSGISGGILITSYLTELYSADYSGNQTVSISAELDDSLYNQYVYLYMYAYGDPSGPYAFIDAMYGTLVANNSSLITFNRDMNGDVAYDTTGLKEYIISDVAVVRGITVLTLKNRSGETGGPSAGSTLQIGVTERGRTIYKSYGFLVDYELTKAYFDCDAIVGGNCAIRWYQEGSVGKALADYMIVTSTDASTIKYTDSQIIQAQGDRNLIIDLYADPLVITNANNMSGITGGLILFGRPLLN